MYTGRCTIAFAISSIVPIRRLCTSRQMHNCLRDQLNCPYKAFMYEQIGDTKKWVVYALYLRQEEPADIKITFVSDIVLEKEEVPFERLKLHILLKLLQIAYIHGERATRFIGQDYCYLCLDKVEAKGGEGCEGQCDGVKFQEE